MENTEKRIIEINGVKMEIDLRHAKVIDHYRVGDTIKVLIKGYGDTFKSHLGVIIGFDNFKELPTVVIAYLTNEYSEVKIEFLYFNEKTKDTEITILNEWDTPITKTTVLNKFQAEQDKKERELADLIEKRRVFESLFGKYFERKETDADDVLKSI